MVDVGEKCVTKRSATARAQVLLPKSVAQALLPSTENAHLSEFTELTGAKGPIFSTATIAGVLGTKKTSDLIPFCHPLPLENVDIRFQILDDKEKLENWFDQKNEGAIVQIDCTVNVTHKTGVEMEALTGVTTAALTVYDMCKAISHDIEIRNVKLLSKSGGKKEFIREN
eukprot:g1370.t1